MTAHSPGSVETVFLKKIKSDRVKLDYVPKMKKVVGLLSNSYKPITNTTWVHAQLCKLQKGCTRLAAASDKVNQLLVGGSLRVLRIRLLPPLKLIAMI